MYRPQQFFQALGLCAILAGLLVTGCRGEPSRRKQAQAPMAAASPVSERAAEATAQKLASAHAHYGAAIIQEMNGNRDAALQEYYLAARDDPGDESLILEVTRRFLQNKQPEKALELLSRAAEQPQASGAVFARLAMVYLQLGKTAAALSAGRTAIRKSPKLLEGYQSLLLVHVQQQQPEEAWNVLQEAARQREPGFEFLLNLSELYANFAIQTPARKEEARAQALELLRRAEKTGTTDEHLQIKLADGFNLLGDTSNAAQLYLQLLNRHPGPAPWREHVHAKLAEIYLRGSDHGKAIEQLKGILREDPTNPLAHYYLGSLAYEDKRATEAVEYFRKTILLSPDFEQAYYDLASAQVSADLPAEALATLEKARRKFSQTFQLELLTGLAYTRQKDYTNALLHFTTAEVVARATDPKRLNYAFYFQVGAAYERKGDYTQAEREFQRCLELKPDFAEALNYLGYMWAERGVNLEKAREYIEKAVQAEPKNAAYLDSLGWVLFKLNQPAAALPYLLQAVDLSEEPDATLYDHLGDVYLAMHEPAKAQEAWRKSLSIEPNDAVRKKLETGGPP